jgi:hypothetical protein
MLVEIFLGKTLNVNHQLEEPQKQRLIELLQLHAKALAWDYIDIKEIHPSLCIHYIYVQDNFQPIRQPQ